MTILTALPDAPSTSDPATFAAKADAFIAALAVLVSEINAAGGVNVGNATTLLGETWDQHFTKADVAAHATTADPWVAPVVVLTGGAVTFTDIADAPYVGAVAWVKQNAAHVWTDGAVFDVQGGADYTAAAGDWIRIYATTVSTFEVTVFPAALGYETGTWTPALTFATPGDLSVTYSTQTGFYTKIGNVVVLNFDIQTSAFTHTTASGDFKITGVPIAALRATAGSMQWGGITLAGYTFFAPQIAQGASELLVVASGSAASTGTINTTALPTGGSVKLLGTITYLTS